MTLDKGEEAKGKREEEGGEGEDEDKDYAEKEAAHHDIQSDSDSESDDEETNGKREREQLEGDEVEALKRDLGEDAREGKRIKTMLGADTEENGNGSGTGEAPSKESEKLWKSLQADTGDSSAVPNKEEKEEEMIFVKKTYRFAGEEVNEEKLLPASHPDAIAYLSSLKDDKAATPSATPTGGSSSISSSTPSLAKPTLAGGPPGPRQKKSSLAAMSAAATGKPAKINTLEKSKMDWNKFKEHSTSEREREEMEAQTRGGGSGLGSMKGYLERKSFLERVQDRLSEQK